MKNSMFSKIGVVRDDDRFIIGGRNGPIIEAKVGDMLESYKSTFTGY